MNTSHFFGGNPDGADDCEGLLEVGTGDSGGAGGSNSPVPRTLAEPSSPCPITLRYKHPLEWAASCNP